MPPLFLLRITELPNYTTYRTGSVDDVLLPAARARPFQLKQVAQSVATPPDSPIP